jgi:hypothetical protein
MVLVRVINEPRLQSVGTNGLDHLAVSPSLNSRAGAGAGLRPPIKIDRDNLPSNHSFSYCFRRIFRKQNGSWARAAQYGTAAKPLSTQVYFYGDANSLFCRAAFGMLGERLLSETGGYPSGPERRHAGPA